MKPGTRSFIRLSVRRKVDLPDPVGPMSAVIDPRFKSTLMSLEHDAPREAEGQSDRAHDALGSSSVRVQGLQGLVDIGLCPGRNGIVTCFGDLSVGHYQERSEAR